MIQVVRLEARDELQEPIHEVFWMRVQSPLSPCPTETSGTGSWAGWQLKSSLAQIPTQPAAGTEPDPCFSLAKLFVFFHFPRGNISAIQECSSEEEDQPTTGLINPSQVRGAQLGLYIRICLHLQLCGHRGSGSVFSRGTDCTWQVCAATFIHSARID